MSDSAGRCFAKWDQAAETITDVQTGHPLAVDVYVNGALLYHLPLDGSAELRAAAPRYHPLALVPKGGRSNKVIHGPVRLAPQK